MKRLLLGFLFFHSMDADRPAQEEELLNIFYDLPCIETERLLLRKVQLEDLFDLYEIYSDPEVIKYIPSECDTCLEDTYKWIGWRLQKYKNGLPTPWVVVLKEAHKVIGLVGFCEWNQSHKCASLMVVEARNYWRCGYMTEALAILFHYSFTYWGLNRIESLVHPENHKALQMHAKFGFRRIGEIPECCYYRGNYCDRVLFTMLKSDYQTW